MSPLFQKYCVLFFTIASIQIQATPLACSQLASRLHVGLGDSRKWAEKFDDRMKLVQDPETDLEERLQIARALHSLERDSEIMLENVGLAYEVLKKDLERPDGVSLHRWRQYHDLFTLARQFSARANAQSRSSSPNTIGHSDAVQSLARMALYNEGKGIPGYPPFNYISERVKEIVRVVQDHQIDLDYKKRTIVAAELAGIPAEQLIPHLLQDSIRNGVANAISERDDFTVPQIQKLLTSPSYLIRRVSAGFFHRKLNELPSGDLSLFDYFNLRLAEGEPDITVREELIYLRERARPRQTPALPATDMAEAPSFQLGEADNNNSKARFYNKVSAADYSYQAPHPLDAIAEGKTEVPLMAGKKLIELSEAFLRSAPPGYRVESFGADSATHGHVWVVLEPLEPSKPVIISFGGTEKQVDWFSNINQFEPTRRSEMQKRVLAKVEGLASEGKQITFLGHSQGGAEAKLTHVDSIVQAVRSYYKDKMALWGRTPEEVFVKWDHMGFNSPGVDRQLRGALHQDEIPYAKSGVEIRLPGDWVSRIFPQASSVIDIPHRSTNPVSAHVLPTVRSAFSALSDSTLPSPREGTVESSMLTWVADSLSRFGPLLLEKYQRDNRAKHEAISLAALKQAVQEGRDLRVIKALIQPLLETTGIPN